MKLVKLYIFQPILSFALYVFTSCFFGLFRAFPPFPFLTTKAICFQRLLFLKPDPSLTVVFLLSFFSFAIQAGVTAVYHNGNEIIVEYNAEYEFSAHQLLSALETEEKKIRKERPELINLIRRRIITVPICKQDDQICLKYLNSARRLHREINSAFQKELVLCEQETGARREGEIHEQNEAYAKANIEQEQLWLRDIDTIQSFVLALIENQENVIGILTDLKESNPEFEYGSKSIGERIAKIKNWVEEHHPSTLIFSVFLNDIEDIYKSQDQRRAQLVSNLYSALLSGNSELLQSFWDFTEETKNIAYSRIADLKIRLEAERINTMKADVKIQNIEQERKAMWDQIKAKSVKRTYPNSNSYSGGGGFLNCHNCLVP